MSEWYEDEEVKICRLWKNLTVMNEWEVTQGSGYNKTDLRNNILEYVYRHQRIKEKLIS